jgi:hypothetical protein
MKRSASIRFILTFFILSVFANAFAGANNDIHPKNFIAVTADDRAILSWTMQKEQLTSLFVVEHSLDGSFFMSLDTIAAEQSNNYHYTHEHASSHAVNYYRVKQLNKNGDVSYSLIRVVRFAEKDIIKVHATPNPVTDALELTVVDNVKLQIKDANNRSVYKKRLNPGQYKLNSASWAPGRYDLSVYQNGKLVEKRSLFKFATAVPGEGDN